MRVAMSNCLVRNVYRGVHAHEGGKHACMCMCMCTCMLRKLSSRLMFTRGYGWRILCGVEFTESSTNKQHIIIITADAGDACMFVTLYFIFCCSRMCAAMARKSTSATEHVNIYGTHTNIARTVTITRYTHPSNPPPAHLQEEEEETRKPPRYH
jgi:hypothetical protein